MSRTRRTAFTLIEVLIVIAIIVILASIALWGGRAVLGGAHERETKITLGVLKAMLGELEAKTRLAKAPPEWLWLDLGGLPVVVSTGSGMDFWRTPYAEASDVLRQTETLTAPGVVTDGGAGMLPRNASQAVLNTQSAMNLILSVPGNRTALQQLPPERYFTPEWQSGTLESGGTDRVMHTSDDPASYTVGYLAGAKVMYTTPGTNDAQRYLASAATSAEPPSSPWVQDQGPPVPVLLDGWNNPIIFVPGTGLRVRLLNGKTALDPDDATHTQTFIIVSPEGRVDRNGSNQPYVTQVGRPFWASAGADGDFATGDDNIYSFEQ